MSHPFFESIEYPWHRPDATAFHSALYKAIRDPAQIDFIYVRCGDDLPQLTPGQPGNLVWREVLENLTTSGKLQELIAQLRVQFPTSKPIQKAIQDVLEAKSDQVHAAGPERSTVPFPTSPPIQKEIQDDSDAPPDEVQVKRSPQITTNIDLRELREAMVKSFSAAELEDICLDVQESLSDAGIDLEVNLDVVGGDGKRSQVLNLIQYLERRRYLSYLVDAVRKARPGII